MSLRGPVVTSTETKPKAEFDGTGGTEYQKCPLFDGIEFDVKLGVGVKICRVKFKHKKSKILWRNLRKKMLIKKMDFRPKNFKKT